MTRHDTQPASPPRQWTAPGFDRVFAFGLLTTLCLLTAGLLLWGSMRDVVLRFVHDDAFYYFGIARQWRRLGFSTFDGLNPTNGYHPLWQWLLIGPAGWFNDFEWFVRAGSAFGVLLIWLSALLIGRRLRAEANPFADLAYYWIAGALVLATIYGLESPLAMLCLALLIRILPYAVDQLKVGRTAICGLIAGLLVLARLDTLIWIFWLDVFALGLAWRFRRSRQDLIKLVAIFGSVQVLLIGAYLVYNLAAWGHLLPISALTKGGRTPLLSMSIPRSLLFLLSFPVTAMGCVLALDFFINLPRKESSKALRLALPAWLGLADACYLGVILLKGGGETYNWYFVNVVLSGAVFLPVFLARYGRPGGLLRAGRLFRLAIAACLLLLFINARGKLFKASSFADKYDQARELAQFAPGSLIFAATDCGILGSVSGQHCLNLDGLTNSFAFQDALRDNTLAEWLRQSGLNAWYAPATAPATKQAILYAPPGIAGIGRRVTLQVSPWPATSQASKPPSLHLYRVTDIQP